MDKRKIVSAILLAILFLVWLSYQRDTGTDIEINNNQTITGSSSDVVSVESNNYEDTEYDAQIEGESQTDEESQFDEVQTDEESQFDEMPTDEESQADEVIQTDDGMQSSIEEQAVVEYRFRNNKLLKQHFEKHGIEMGFANAKEYEKRASAVVNDPNALHKTEKEDDDDVYYLEDSNEFVIVSTDGYIRTYFNPNGGINYYNRQ